MNGYLRRNVRTLALATCLRNQRELTKGYSTVIVHRPSLRTVLYIEKLQRLNQVNFNSQESSFKHRLEEIMTDTATELTASHDEQKKEFYIRLSEDSKSAKAVLQYELVGKDCMDMYHTGVPVEFRGKGVAKILAKAAMDFAVEKNMKMMLTCTYLQKYVKDNPLPQYTERVIQSS